MKNLIAKMFLSFTLIASYQAPALVQFGAERPVQKSSVAEVDADGHELRIGLKKEITEYKSQQGRLATAFSFFEERQVECISAPCPLLPRTLDYIVVDHHTDLDGVVVYQAVEKHEFERTSVVDGLNGLNQPTRSLELTDFSKLNTGEYVKNAWEIKITDLEGGKKVTRLLQGNPGPTFSIQLGCQIGQR